MDIHIKVIPPGTHREGITGADWTWTPEGDLEVRVSKMSDQRYELCLALHEATEAIMCFYHGVTQKMVDDFDMPFVARGEDDVDVGDLPDCPYRKEHGHATAIERVLASELGIVWKAYDDELRRLK